MTRKKWALIVALALAIPGVAWAGNHAVWDLCCCDEWPLTK